MKRKILPLLIGAALLLPVLVFSDDAESVNVYTVTYRDYDGSDMMTIPVTEGRSIEDTHPSTYTMRPYWAEWHTGYYWPIDKAVSSDTYLRACEEKPPEEPEDTTGYGIAAGVGIMAGVLLIIEYATFRRK